jgi:hypothetical protein
MFLMGFQDVTWIEVAPQGPCPEGVPHTCTAVPGGIQGFGFRSILLKPLDNFKVRCANTHKDAPQFYCADGGKIARKLVPEIARE